MSDENISYEAVLAALITRRDKLNAAIEALEELAGLEPTGSMDPRTLGRETPARSQTVSEDTFLGMSAPKATIAYLKMMKRPQTTRQIADALIQGGIHSTSANFMNRIYTALHRHKEIIRLGDKWSLREWHPGARVAPKKKTAQITPDVEEIDVDEEDDGYIEDGF